MHIYKYTPFVYFSKAAIWSEVKNISETVKYSTFSKVSDRMIEKYKNASFIADNVIAAKLLKISADCVRELCKISAMAE